MTDTGLELGASTQDSSVEEFAKVNKEYYATEFKKIQGTTGFAWSWNTMAAVFGPLWGAFRGAWGFFWTFLVLELFVLVQLGRGLWGELGADQLARYERLLVNIAKREGQAAEALAVGDVADHDAKMKIADNLKKVAESAKEAATEAATQATGILITGLILLVIVKIFEGYYANITYEKQYLKWRANSKAVQSGTNQGSAIFGVVLMMAIWPLTLFRFTVVDPDAKLNAMTNGILGGKIPITEFPIKKEIFAVWAKELDEWFDIISRKFGTIFDGVTYGIRSIIAGIEVLLVQTPWPVVMVVIVVMAFRLAGIRVAIFTAASLAYLAFMGLWELSMLTIALVGAGTTVCIILGIPLGIWVGKSNKVHAFFEPILDFMQTMPAFVYLIPIIAFFGTGAPPGVLAIIIFAMPPVIRLTALGMRGVPEATKEAAVAFGCSKWQLLRNVEVPLAMPSIMTGINQCILFSLSMVVIAALIGARGLGAEILEALQYVAKGQGLLAGLAILLCAMVMDRIAQGMYRRSVGTA